jgi:tetratricopeptide (TPR) repeat protein
MLTLSAHFVDACERVEEKLKGHDNADNDDDRHNALKEWQRLIEGNQYTFTPEEIAVAQFNALTLAYDLNVFAPHDTTLLCEAAALIDEAFQGALDSALVIALSLGDVDTFQLFCREKTNPDLLLWMQLLKMQAQDKVLVPPEMHSRPSVLEALLCFGQGNFRRCVELCERNYHDSMRATSQHHALLCGYAYAQLKDYTMAVSMLSMALTHRGPELPAILAPLALALSLTETDTGTVDCDNSSSNTNIAQKQRLSKRAIQSARRFFQSLEETPLAPSGSLLLVDPPGASSRHICQWEVCAHILGCAAFDAGHYAAAVGAFQSLCQRCPPGCVGNGRLYQWNLAVAYAKQGEWQQTAQLLEESGDLEAAMYAFMQVGSWHAALECGALGDSLSMQLLACICALSQDDASQSLWSVQQLLPMVEQGLLSGSAADGPADPELLALGVMTLGIALMSLQNVNAAGQCFFAALATIPPTSSHVLDVCFNVQLWAEAHAPGYHQHAITTKLKAVPLEHTLEYVGELNRLEETIKLRVSQRGVWEHV